MLDFLTNNGGEILEAATKLIAAASVVANITPTDKDNKAVVVLSGIINFFALNFFAMKKGGGSQ